VSVSLTMATNVDDVIDQLLLDLFLESQETAPPQIILDLDGTDIPLYGKQEGRFFRYVPLYIFCGDHLLCAVAQPAIRLTLT
jgi:Transposase DDE domain group 1